MANYFITGGAGFLGINLTRFLLEKGHGIVSFDIEKEYNYPEKNDARVKAITGDIRDIQAVRGATRGCDIVVHAAAAQPLYSDIVKNDPFLVKNELFLIKNELFLVKNEPFLVKNEPFLVKNASLEDIRSTDIDGTRNVLQAAYELGISRFIQVSSTAVYDIPDHHPLLENDKLVGVVPYGAAKNKLNRRVL